MKGSLCVCVWNIPVSLSSACVGSTNWLSKKLRTGMEEMILMRLIKSSLLLLFFLFFISSHLCPLMLCQNLCHDYLRTISMLLKEKLLHLISLSRSRVHCSLLWHYSTSPHWLLCHFSCPCSLNPFPSTWMLNFTELMCSYSYTRCQFVVRAWPSLLFEMKF